MTRPGHMVVHITRFLFVTIGALSGFATSRLIDWTQETGFPEYFVIFIFIILGWSVGYLLGGILGRELARVFVVIEEHLQEFSAADFILAAAGMLVGLVVAALISWPLRLIEPAWLAVLATLGLFVLFTYTFIRIALLKRTDVAVAFPRLSGDGLGVLEPNRMLLLDTSAVIDGRFVELRALGYLPGDMRVPRFVLSELQALADSADDIKRARGRRGLDLLDRLKGSNARLELLDADATDVSDTDGKLMAVAEERGAAIVTTDFNMMKVARVRGLEVLNLNEAAGALRPAYLPGEPLRLAIVKRGKEPGQGVGYLPDGTMVVVHDAAEFAGTEVDAEVTSVLQTSGGRMIFANFTAVARSSREGSGED